MKVKLKMPTGIQMAQVPATHPLELVRQFLPGRLVKTHNALWKKKIERTGVGYCTVERVHVLGLEARHGLVVGQTVEVTFARGHAVVSSGRGLACQNPRAMNPEPSSTSSCPVPTLSACVRPPAASRPELLPGVPLPVLELATLRPAVL